MHCACEELELCRHVAKVEWTQVTGADALRCFHQAMQRTHDRGHRGDCTRATEGEFDTKEKPDTLTSLSTARIEPARPFRCIRFLDSEQRPYFIEQRIGRRGANTLGAVV